MAPTAATLGCTHVWTRTSKPMYTFRGTQMRTRMFPESQSQVKARVVLCLCVVLCVCCVLCSVCFQGAGQIQIRGVFSNELPPDSSLR